MSGTLSEMGFGGGSRVTSLPCGFGPAMSNLSMTSPAISTLSGATVAGTGTLKTLLNVVGSRLRLNALMVFCADATPRNVRLVITIDGTVVFDNINAFADTNRRVAVGSVVFGTSSSLLFQPIDALNSLKIEFGCSLAETDKLTFSYNYEVR